jgi:hypothetical protein
LRVGLPKLPQPMTPSRKTFDPSENNYLLFNNTPTPTYHRI